MSKYVFDMKSEIRIVNRQSFLNYKLILPMSLFAINHELILFLPRVNVLIDRIGRMSKFSAFAVRI